MQLYILGVNCDMCNNCPTAYPAVYGQFPQPIPPPMPTIAPAQRDGK